MYSMMKIVLVGLALIASLVASSAHAENASSPLGSYANLSTYCGHDPIQTDPATIPEFGCFRLTSKHTASATISTHVVQVGVGDDGNEFFSADGIQIEEVPDPSRKPPHKINLPFVNEASSGYGFCENDATGYCPVHITVFSRDPDKSVLFMVSHCLPPNNQVCVSTKRNWDYEMSKRQ